MLTVILGRTASGKTTVVEKLKKEHNFSQIIIYTTRPMRPGETQDVTYHFISEEDFKRKIEQDFFLEYKVYHTIQGDWYYGSAKEDFLNSKENTVVILPPASYLDFLKLLPNLKHKSIYICSYEDVMRQRLLERGDDIEEANRRIAKDREDFIGVLSFADKVIHNTGKTTIEDLVKEILEEARYESE